MPPTTPRTRTGRPTRAEADELEDRIRRTAVELFLEHGFDATSMNALAVAAGVTKRTLYARYGDKRTVFVAAISWAMAQLRWEQPPSVDEADDLVAGLTTIARATLERAIDPDITRLIRMAITESARFPELATSIDSITYSPRVDTVAHLLARHITAGTIVLDDVEIAAEQFLAMVVALPARLASYGIYRQSEVEERHLLHAVDLFLRGALTR